MRPEGGREREGVRNERKGQKRAEGKGGAARETNPLSATLGTYSCNHGAGMCFDSNTHTHTRTAVIRVHVPEKRGVTQFSHEPGEDGNAPYYLSLCFAYFLSLVVFSSVYTATSAWLHSVELR